MMPSVMSIKAMQFFFCETGILFQLTGMILVVFCSDFLLEIRTCIILFNQLLVRGIDLFVDCILMAELIIQL